MPGWAPAIRNVWPTGRTCAAGSRPERVRLPAGPCPSPLTGESIYATLVVRGTLTGQGTEARHDGVDRRALRGQADGRGARPGSTPRRSASGMVSDIGLMPTLSAELQSVRVAGRGDRAGPRRPVHRLQQARRVRGVGDHVARRRVRAAAGVRLGGRGPRTPHAPSGGSPSSREDGGTELRQWMQMGPGRSGLSFAIDRMPEKEQKIVFVRMREFEREMTATLAAIKERAESPAPAGAEPDAHGDHGRGVRGDWRETVDFVMEAEKLGLDICWVAEAWGSEAPSPLGYLAARTDRMLLGSGIIQLGTRTPVAIAQAAITLSQMSEGRFLLGPRPVRAAGDRGAARRAVRPAADADAGDRRDRPAGVRGREDLATPGRSSASRCPAATPSRCGCRCAPNTTSRSTWRPCRRRCCS